MDETNLNDMSRPTSSIAILQAFLDRYDSIILRAPLFLCIHAEEQKIKKKIFFSVTRLKNIKKCWKSMTHFKSTHNNSMQLSWDSMPFSKEILMMEVSENWTIFNHILSVLFNTF